MAPFLKRPDGIATAAALIARAPVPDVYETTDGGWMAVCPLGRAFYAELVDPAPRFSRTPAHLITPPPPAFGTDTRAAFEAWGIPDVDALLASGGAVPA